MSTPYKSRPFGFVLIEALIALLLISVGLLAVSKLQLLSISGSGEAKARSEAMALSQQKIEELRNIVVRSGFTGTPLETGNSSTIGSNATYVMSWNVSALATPPAAVLEQRVLTLTTTWTDRFNTVQSLDLNTVIAWDDPGLQSKANKGVGVTLISPTGAAQRGSGSFESGTGTPNADNRSRTHTVDGTTYLLANNGTILLFLPPLANGDPQSFTRITGRIYFDQNAGNNAIPRPANVKIRLSSEGECIYDNEAQLTPASNGSNSYGYFTYTCYVGSGWYGNVGVLVDDSVSGQAGDPTICVGDPGFNSGVSDGTLISAHPIESGTRSYRGFKASTGPYPYLSTGMGGSSGNELLYGLSYAGDGTPLTGPFAGRPRPSSYPSYYSGVASGSAADYFDQDFLITRVSGSASCRSKMAGGEFRLNAGKYVCINPDNDSAADACPAVWPRFEGEVGTGGSINFPLTVTRAGSGTGTVVSSPAGINCGTTCSFSVGSGTSVVLTATPDTGSTFTNWTGCGSTSGNTCTVAVAAATAVTVTFTTSVAATFPVTVTKAGTGTGSVSSSPSGVSCGSICTASFNSGTSVILTAAADANSTFTGWSGGGCPATGTCTVLVTSAQSVTATFSAVAANQTLTVGTAGTGGGMVASAAAGINCPSACSATLPTNTVVTLTATPNGTSSFTGWSGGGCSGTGSCAVTLSSSVSVTAIFAINAYQLSVTKSGAGSGTVSSPSGINCGATCAATFNSGTSVTLTAVANGGSSVDVWSGGSCSGAASVPCTVSMTAARSVSASFTANALCTTPISGTAYDKNGSVAASPSGFGSCTMGNSNANFTCSFSAPSGTIISLTNARTTGNAGDQYTASQTITGNCVSQTNVNFNCAQFSSGPVCKP